MISNGLSRRITIITIMLIIGLAATACSNAGDEETVVNQEETEAVTEEAPAATTTDVEPVSETIAEEVDRHWKAGMELLGKDKSEDAIAEFDKAIGLDPEFAMGYASRGLAYAGLGQNEQAIQDYGEAIRVDPLDTSTYFLRSGIYQVLGQNDRALVALDEAIRLDPQDGNAYFVRAETLNQLGRQTDAQKDYERAEELGVKP